MQPVAVRTVARTCQTRLRNAPARVDFSDMAYSLRVCELLRRVRDGHVMVDVADADAVRTVRQAERLGLVTVTSLSSSMHADHRLTNLVVTGLTRLGEHAVQAAPTVK